MRRTDQLDGNTLPKEYHHVAETQQGYGNGPQVISTNRELEILCGPLLNYQRMSEEDSSVIWHGTVLLVTKPGQKLPQLQLVPLAGRGGKKLVDGLKLYADPDKTFWRFSLQVPLTGAEAKWQYTIPNVHFLSNVSKDPSRVFTVPAATESMRIMFHSCNGFSVGTDEDFWSGTEVCI